MLTHRSCTADATSDIGSRVKVAIGAEGQRLDDADAKEREEVQAKINELQSKGFLKRQGYVAASNSDFQRIFYEKS